LKDGARLLPQTLYLSVEYYVIWMHINGLQR